MTYFIITTIVVAGLSFVFLLIPVEKRKSAEHAAIPGEVLAGSKGKQSGVPADIVRGAAGQSQAPNSVGRNEEDAFAAISHSAS